MVPVFYYSNCNGYQNIIKISYQNWFIFVLIYTYKIIKQRVVVILNEKRIMDTHS